MEPWGFVFLAYGIVWTTILVYLLTLKRRLQRASAELARIDASEKRSDDA